jgi:hypothetical protein
VLLFAASLYQYGESSVTQVRCRHHPDGGEQCHIEPPNGTLFGTQSRFASGLVTVTPIDWPVCILKAINGISPESLMNQGVTDGNLIAAEIHHERSSERCNIANSHSRSQLNAVQLSKGMRAIPPLLPLRKVLSPARHTSEITAPEVLRQKTSHNKTACLCIECLTLHLFQTR